ncbi:MAG: ABC transporter permease [Betaproteobacteria bacterium]|nr:ABC transporter permease [Betaproteobacteria bacterium]
MSDLIISGVEAGYGHVRVLHGVNLKVSDKPVALMGRNGMGKTTLAQAIMGLNATTAGTITYGDVTLTGLSPTKIANAGIGYVPQGRRVFPSLTVDEHLRILEKRTSKWSAKKVYELFPRLAERKKNGGAMLSGGEQQMLAIGRALMTDPTLLLMDEPSEGLAPAIVEHLGNSLRDLVAQGQRVLLIEQNLGVATSVADRIGIMVNGRIAQEMPAGELAADRELQERLLGVRSHGDDDVEAIGQAAGRDPSDLGAQTSQEARVLTVVRAHGGSLPGSTDPTPRTTHGFNRWNLGSPSDPVLHRSSAFQNASAAAEDAPVAASEVPGAKKDHRAEEPSMPTPARAASVFDFPVAKSSARAAYVAGTFDTKGRELFYLRQCLERLGLRVVTVDLSTNGRTSTASVHPREVARHHPKGEAGVFTGDRGSAVAAMALAFEQFVLTRRDLGGLISAGGSGGTTLATAAMRALPVGVPKLMVSTMASGDTRPYVGPSDICMMYSVTDVQGLNRISERVLANAAHALAGMINHPVAHAQATKPALGLTMFGVTTPCVQMLTTQLEPEFDCLVFHATGVGGQSMEKLADSGLLEGVIDVSTTEIADEIAGGTLSAGPGRLDVFARHALPWVGSCGALDMANFGAWDSVPERFRGRRLYRHNPSVTLMRTSPEECQAIGEFLVAKINAMRGPVRFLIPEEGLSAIDRQGQPFYDPQANQILFDTIEKGFRGGVSRRLLRLPHHINDEAFAKALLAAWRDVSSANDARRA